MTKPTQNQNQPAEGRQRFFSQPDPFEDERPAVGVASMAMPRDPWVPKAHQLFGAMLEIRHPDGSLEETPVTVDGKLVLDTSADLALRVGQGLADAMLRDQE